ncbi:MAG: dihydroorotase [Bacteroidota bacterium]|nr:dihydroorotase [Bacteroidota bacterium]
MKSYLIKNAKIIDSAKIFFGDIFIKNKRIEKILPSISNIKENFIEINAENKTVIPGVIDDHVHFREPGLTHKGNINSESKAALAGGVTSIMEMPNTKPQTTTITELNNKFDLASKQSYCNYSFYLGATDTNLDELKKINSSETCGVKIFLGSSTGNMLIDNVEILSKIFSNISLLKAVHAEKDEIINSNLEKIKKQFGEDIPIKYHSKIRSEEACFASSEFAINLAKKFNSRLHILHLSTEKEVELLDNQTPLKEKLITAEACVHHLWFDENDYDKYGTRIKWNPAIKNKKDKDALLQAVINNKIDVIATDHAPHTIEEKQNSYLKAPSGGPLIQHSLTAMLELYSQGKISLEKIVEKMCHSPADIFNINNRGYLKEGYWADLVIIDTNLPWIVKKENILYKCAWSPFENTKFNSKVTHTFINGNLAFENEKFNNFTPGMKLKFNRKNY